MKTELCETCNGSTRRYANTIEILPEIDVIDIREMCSRKTYLLCSARLEPAKCDYTCQTSIIIW